MRSCLDHKRCILFKQYMTHLIIILVLGVFESIPRCLESQKMLWDSRNIYYIGDMIKDILSGMKMGMS